MTPNIHRLSLRICYFIGPWILTVLSYAQTITPPHLFWRNNVTGANEAWIMNGASHTTTQSFAAKTADPLWRVVGVGNFHGGVLDGVTDILWYHADSSKQMLVWRMQVINGQVALKDQAWITPAAAGSWEPMAVGDFNRDNQADILFEDSTGATAVWYMNGLVNYDNQTIYPTDPAWRIVQATDQNGDGLPEILFRNNLTGQNAFWYLALSNNRVTLSDSHVTATVPDLDWKIVGTGDYNGDGRRDLVWRHATLGLNQVYYMNDFQVLSGVNIEHRFNTDWKICNQDFADSAWRLSFYNNIMPRVSASIQTTPPEITLNYAIKDIVGSTTTIARKDPINGTWAVRASGQNATGTYKDTVTSGLRYEYRIYEEGFGGTQDAATLVAGLNIPPLEKPGRLILLVDQTLASRLVGSLNILKDDLESDGWTVLRHDVPRHVDSYGPGQFYVNRTNIRDNIQPLINADYDQDPVNTKYIFIVGHVSIPYSGLEARDGHSGGTADHQGAWPADIMYGDRYGSWSDSSVNYDNQSTLMEPDNIPGDGKFDQDFVPLSAGYPPSQLPLEFIRLAVGRVDFARLPAFNGTCGTPDCEVALLQRYFAKNHNYRRKLLPWQAGNYRRCIAYGYFNDPDLLRNGPLYENAIEGCRHMFGSGNAVPPILSVGDFFLQRLDSFGAQKAYLWGFQSGSGLGDGLNHGGGVTQHLTSDLGLSSNEPTAVFYMHLASYFGDWNLGINNYLRGLLTTPSYGLASVWIRYGHWRLDAPALGEPLGSALLRMVNNPRNSLAYGAVTGDQGRELAIMGDPTLRMEVVAPPAVQYDANTKKLSWFSADAESYFIYFASTASGPYSRIFPTNPYSNPPAGYYMVRAIKTISSGNGSHQSISHGTKLQI